MIDVCVFGDACLSGTSAVVYGFTLQPSGIKKRLIESKSRLSRKQLLIQGLELVAAQMVANVTDNTQKFLRNYNIREVCVCTVSAIVYTGHKAMEFTNTFFVTE